MQEFQCQTSSKKAKQMKYRSDAKRGGGGEGGGPDPSDPPPGSATENYATVEILSSQYFVYNLLVISKFGKSSSY